MSPGPGTPVASIQESEDLLWSEVISNILDEPPASRGGSRGPASRQGSRGSRGAPSSPSLKKQNSRLAATPSPQVSEWSRPLVVEQKFCRHQRRQYTVLVAADLMDGEAFGKLRRRGYGSKLKKPKKKGLPAASSQFDFPGMQFTSRSDCADATRRRNLAPTLERFPVLKTSGVRPPIPDLDEIDAADAAAAWNNPQKNTVQDTQEPRFRLDRPWLAGNPQPRLLERQVGGLCEPWDDQYFSPAPSPSKHIQAAPRARTAPGDTPRKTPSMQRLSSKEPEKKEKSLKSKLKEAFMKQMAARNEQGDVIQEMTSEATRARRRSSDGGLRFQHDPSSNPSDDNSEEVRTKGLWRLHHKESKRSRLYRVSACRRNKDQSEQDIMTGYRDRVHRYEVEVAQESFLRHFPAKQGNPWRNDDILEALADFGIKAQSRTEKIALKTVLSEHEDDEFGFNTYCSIIEEARCKLRSSRTHTVFQSFKYADTEDLGGLSVTGVMKMLQNLNLTFEKGSEERQTVEAMASDCRKDPATGLIGLSEVEFLVSAVREFMVQSKRRRERELKVEYQLPDALFQQFRSQLIQFHVSFKDLDDDDSGKLDPNEAMNLLTHFGCITSGMPLEKKLRAQAIVSRYLLDAEQHLLSFDRFLCVVQDLRVLGMEEKVEIVQSHFNQYDRDQSGLLTIKEICQILMDLKIQPRSLSEQEAMAQLIEEADSNGSGTLSVEDLLLLVQRILERIGELNRAELLQKAEALGFTRKQAQALWETFEALDVSQDGLMDIMEVGQALSLMKWQMSAAKLERHIMVLDADGNGQLDFVEFLQLMRRMLDDVQAPAAVKIKAEEPGSPRRPEEDGSAENTPQKRGRGAVSLSPVAPKKRSG